MTKPSKPDVNRVDWKELGKNCLKAALAGFVCALSVSDDPSVSLLSAAVWAAARGVAGATYQSIYGEALPGT